MEAMRSRFLIAVSVAALAAGGAGALLFAPGLATAQDDPPADAPAEEEPAKDAAPFERRGSLLADALAELVEEGVIDQAQADAVQERLEELRPRLADRMHRRGGLHPAHVGLDAAAEAIGIDPADLRDALLDGQSLAEVAEANGVDRQAVVDALTAEVQTRIDVKVESGDLDQERADELAATAAERIEALVDRTFERPEGFDGFRGRFRDRFGAGFGRGGDFG